MKQFLFFGMAISLMIAFSISKGYSNNTKNNYFFSKKIAQTTNTTSFINYKGPFPYSPIYEKSLYSQSSTSPQIDTTKKKIPLPNKGSGNTQVQNIVTNEIDGLLLNATFSPGAYDFYIDFSQNWTPPIGASNYKIVVKEYPGRGVNMVVAIEVNDKQLVFRRMRPVYPAIHGLAVAAANYLNGYIAKGDHLRGVDADGNFIDVQRTDVTRQIKTPFDIY